MSTAPRPLRLGHVQLACLEQAADYCNVMTEWGDHDCDWSGAEAAMRSLRCTGEFPAEAVLPAVRYALIEWANGLDDDLRRARSGEDRAVIRQLSEAATTLLARLRP